MSVAPIWYLFVFAFAIFPIALGESDCKVKISSTEKYATVYFQYFRWTRPKSNLGSRISSIKSNTFVKLSCDNGFVNEQLTETSYTFQCLDGKYNKTFEIEDLLCRSSYHKFTETSQISPIQLKSKIFKCDQNGWDVLQVKARQPDGSLKHLYTSCFDKNVMRTKFVFQHRRKESPIKSNDTRNDVWGLDFFGRNSYLKVKLSEGYVSKIQKDRITKAFPERYDSQHQYPYSFNRGHLAPYADFTESQDRHASCVYINVAPQWREFNGNSWSLVERETRDMVKSKPFDWEIYTGTYSSIPTTKGPLFVSPIVNKDGKYIKSYVPVPKLFWKVVYNIEDKNKSKVFIGINNPELKSPKEFSEKYVICKPIPDKKGNRFRGSEFKGFVYECALEEFLEKLRVDEKIVK